MCYCALIKLLLSIFLICVSKRMYTFMLRYTIWIIVCAHIRVVHFAKQCTCILHSGYTGTERDALMHVAILLGAHCQEFLVRKAHAKKKLEANTHLIVNMDSGSKYEAATKWGIPALSKK